VAVAGGETAREPISSGMKGVQVAHPRVKKAKMRGTGYSRENIRAALKTLEARPNPPFANFE
jgi:hypothetical protein